MRRALIGILLEAVACFGQQPVFNSANELQFPNDYREWIYLASGLGMTYGPASPGPLEDPRFDTVFVNPSAWKAFRETGKWPEGTFFILEIRYSTSQGSINKGGFYQTDVAAIEAHVKDKRFPGGWGFFTLGGGFAPSQATAKEMGPRGAGCRNCHVPNGVVDSTFTQFYPTALDIATHKGTVNPDFKPPAPSPVAFMHTVQEKGLPAAQQALAAAQASDPKAAVLREPVLNSVGYGLLQFGSKDKAIEVFQLICEKFPQSANAQDSLAEALEGAGRKEEALAASRKAVVLLENDKSLDDRRRANLKQALDERLARLQR